jgi:hypothetical protein
MSSIDIANGAIFPPGNKDGQILFASGHQPAVPGINLKLRFQTSVTDKPVKELVRKQTFFLSPSTKPFFLDVSPNAFDGFLRDASVGDTIQAPLEQLQFIVGGQVTVPANPDIGVVGNQIEDIFFQIGTGAANGMNFFFSDHFRQREAYFRCAHGACQGQTHVTILFEMPAVSFRRIE